MVMPMEFGNVQANHPMSNAIPGLEMFIIRLLIIGEVLQIGFIASVNGCFSKPTAINLRLSHYM